MGTQYRYRPAGNRTPVSDPVFGHLTYDGVYTDPRCGADPRFEEIPAAKRTEAAPKARTAIVSPEHQPDKPPASPRADAGTPGRSV